MTQKVGLALSGGGFRAAFYHLGVLARLADEDRLRRVEVVSAVSGGSIIAALYGLRMRAVLESKPDGDITREDYQHVVWRVGHDLRKGVRRNLRMRLFSNPWASLKMLRPDYSRSDRMAWLYERFLYKGLGTHDPVRMSDLLVAPHGTETTVAGFDPDVMNPTRAAKVPVVLLNATVLNTGHNWRFEGTRMGEPPRDGPGNRNDDRIDKNMRLERAATYADLPDCKKGIYREFPLKYGVAASTAVPGVFVPLSLSGLYPDVRVQLVDGGVHDNQGMQGLLDRDCTTVWVSDASGQMGDVPHPGPSILRVLPRANSVMGDRMREEQLIGRLDLARAGDQVVHLKEGVVPPVVPFVGSTTPAVPSGQPYVRAVAGIRTDLDAFHDVESYALAQGGYDAAGDTGKRPVMHAAWPFLNVDRVPEKKRLRLLRLGGHKFAKPFRVNAGMKALGVALLALLGFGLWRAGAAAGWGNVFGVPGLAVLGGLLSYVLLVVLVQHFVPNRGLGAWVRGIVRGVVGVPLALVGMVLTNAYLWLLNGIYLRAGAVPDGDWPASPDAAASDNPHAVGSTAASS